MSVDTGAFQNAFQMKMTEEELTELIMSLMSNGTRSFDANLSKLGYADSLSPRRSTFIRIISRTSSRSSPFWTITTTAWWPRGRTTRKSPTRISWARS